MATQRIFPATDGPAVAFSDNAIGNAVEFKTNVTAWVTHIHYFRGITTQQAPSSLDIWRVDSATAGTNMGAVAPSDPGAVTGWQTVALPTPVALVSGQAYRASALYSGATGDKYTATTLFWTSGGGGAADIVNGFLTAPTGANAVGNDQGSYDYMSVPTMPVSSFNFANYWIDVTVTDVDPTGPPPITGRFAPDAILAQTGLTGAVAAVQDDPDSPDGSWLVG